MMLFEEGWHWYWDAHQFAMLLLGLIPHARIFTAELEHHSVHVCLLYCNFLAF